MPDFNASGEDASQTNLILPQPCEFIRKDLPVCSVVRPTVDDEGGAVATIKSFTDDHLLGAQSPKFFRMLTRSRERPTPLQRQVAHGG